MSRRGAFRMYLFVRVRYTDFSIGGVGNVAYICVSDLCPGIGGGARWICREDNWGTSAPPNHQSYLFTSSQLRQMFSQLMSTSLALLTRFDFIMKPDPLAE